MWVSRSGEELSWCKTAIHCLLYFLYFTNIFQGADTVKVWLHLQRYSSTNLLLIQSLVGLEINVPFQHNNRLYWGQDLGWRFSSAKWRMANDMVTSRPHCLFIQRRPKMGKDREAHLSYYASAYNRVETNQPPLDLFISSIWYLI